jgi:hypothetical protein
MKRHDLPCGNPGQERPVHVEESGSALLEGPGATQAGGDNMNGLPETEAAFEELGRFIGNDQLAALRILFLGEERQYFFDKVCDLRDLIASMPKTCTQDGKGDKAVIYLHYFIGNCDWYIIEKDCEEEQLQAFGIADLGYGPEYGYISIQELLENGVELDLYYQPRTVAEQMEGRRLC